MAESIDPKYVQELEHLTSRIIKGNITPLVFEILKKTTDLDGLLSHLGCKIERTKVVEKPAESSIDRPDFATLFKNSEPV